LQFLEQGKKRKKNIPTLNSQNSNLAEKKFFNQFNHCEKKFAVIRK